MRVGWGGGWREEKEGGRGRRAVKVARGGINKSGLNNQMHYGAPFVFHSPNARQIEVGGRHKN